MTSGGSFGASSLRPHIGIGKATVVDRLEIRWPGTGLVQRFEGPIDADRVYEITEGKPELKAIASAKTVAARSNQTALQIDPGKR